MVFLVLVMPILLLGTLLAMHAVERWLDSEAPTARRIDAPPRGAPVPTAALVSPRRA